MKKAKLITANRKRQRGFTLIEMMITISIAAILLSLAVPSFSAMQRRSQINTQTNALVSGLALARSEASKRGQRVSMCARNGTLCTASTDWSNGWLAFLDLNGNGNLDAGEDLLQASPTTNQGVTLTSTQNAITYQVSGENLTQTSITITKSGCGSGEKRVITVEVTGRTSLAKSDCP